MARVGSPRGGPWDSPCLEEEEDTGFPGGATTQVLGHLGLSLNV